MKQSLFIEQIMVVGEAQKMPAAIIQPNFEYIAEWQKEGSIDLGKSHADWITNSKLVAAIAADIEKHNSPIWKMGAN